MFCRILIPDLICKALWNVPICTSILSSDGMRPDLLKISTAAKVLLWQVADEALTLWRLPKHPIWNTAVVGPIWKDQKPTKKMHKSESYTEQHFVLDFNVIHYFFVMKMSRKPKCPNPANSQLHAIKIFIFYTIRSSLSQISFIINIVSNKSLTLLWSSGSSPKCYVYGSADTLLATFIFGKTNLSSRHFSCQLSCQTSSHSQVCYRRIAPSSNI